MDMSGTRVPAKGRDPRQEDQRRRRSELLERQKSRRAALTAQSRGFVDGHVPNVDSGPGPATSPCAVELGRSADGTRGMEDAGMVLELPASSTPTETMDVGAGGGYGGRGGGRRQGREVALMAAEWMVDIPGDLGRCWSVLARPAGVRCLVTSGGGETTRHTKGGHTRRFPSALPGGNRVARGAGGCELECVWVESSLTYYVLDVLRWKGLCLADQTHELRAFWLASRLSETRAAAPASTNPCRFLHAPPLPCTAPSLHRAYTGEGFGYARDGLLFFHREGLYEPGPSPLVLLWSDAHCSARFFDYGTAQMEQALVADPDKGARWRAAEVEAAHGFAALLEACQEEEMDAAEGEEAGAGMQIVGLAASYDTEMVT